MPRRKELPELISSGDIDRILHDEGYDHPIREIARELAERVTVGGRSVKAIEHRMGPVRGPEHRRKLLKMLLDKMVPDKKAVETMSKHEYSITVSMNDFKQVGGQVVEMKQIEDEKEADHTGSEEDQEGT